MRSGFTAAPTPPPVEAPAGRSLYVWPRDVRRQLILDRWQVTHTDPGAEPSDLDAGEWHDVEPGAMIQWQWFAAVQGPHPYLGRNSSDFRWMEERTWWFRTAVDLPEAWSDEVDRLDLVFDGLDHDATIWIDRVRTADHFGAFGGPALDVSSLLTGSAGRHEVLVAISPAGTGRGKAAGETGRLVKAETYSRWINNPDLMTAGIWRPIRLIATAGYRLERPQVDTRLAADGSARIDVEVEVLRADVTPDLAFVTRYGQAPPLDDPRFAQRAAPASRLRLTLHDAAGTIVAQDAVEFEPVRGRQWLRRTLELAEPELWWPNGLGDPHLYRLTIALEQGEAVCDELITSVGIRTFELTRSDAPRTAEHWLGWQPKINGHEVFLRGMNWMPLDLLRLSSTKYEHFLRLARESGVQLLRVWGGGLIETDEFFSLCDELGLLVWQDFPLNTDYRCGGLPLDVWEQQVVWSIARLRNHPSLVVWCGGNEFDPYLDVNAAAVGIMERSVTDLDGSRPFVRACSDAGDVHPYLDFDTSWYLPLYRQAPAITEWGGHSLPAYDSLREFMPEAELARPLAILDAPDPARFEDSHPTLRQHWAEFNPTRIPRMLDRARIFDDLDTAENERFVEAVQLGAAEIYETVGTDFRAGDVAATMVMPWVFSRPWPSVGMQVIDHSGRPTPAYAAIRRSYAPIALAIRCPHEALAPGERVPVQVAVNRDADEAVLAAGQVRVRIYDDSLTLQRSDEDTIGRHDFVALDVAVPDRPGYLIIVADLIDGDGVRRARAVRFLRVIEQLADPSIRAGYRRAPQPTALHHRHGLRPLIARTATTLDLKITRPLAADAAGPTYAGAATVINSGQLPAPYVRWCWPDPDWILDAEDDYFWLEPGESRRLTVTLTPAHRTSSFAAPPADSDPPDLDRLRVAAWNSDGTQ